MMRCLNISEYCAENSIKVPDDLAVCGFDNVFESSCSRPPLTTSDPHIAKLALAVLNIFRQRRAGSLSEPINIEIEPELIVRQST